MELNPSMGNCAYSTCIRTLWGGPSQRTNHHAPANQSCSSSTASRYPGFEHGCTYLQPCSMYLHACWLDLTGARATNAKLINCQLLSSRSISPVYNTFFSVSHAGNHKVSQFMCPLVTKGAAHPTRYEGWVWYVHGLRCSKQRTWWCCRNSWLLVTCPLYKVI
jgi:hypothetical protein